MDITSYLQRFEGSQSSYTGDDPLDPWDKFVEYLEQRLPADAGSGMSLVFDRLVQRFMNVEQYANDIRYVNYCIKCAGYYSDPIALFSHIYSKGIGTRTAALYVAWAQQFEHRGLNEQAEAVYQRAAENQAQPADLVLHEHRQFQTRSGSHTTVSAGGRTPLQNSNLTNQMSSHREAGAQNKASGDCLPKPQTHKTTIYVSRSETSGSLPSSHGGGAQTVSAYLKEALVCEGSELCFEEVRAEKYFRRLQEQQEKEEREMRKMLLRQQEEDILSMRCMLETVNQELQAFGGSTSRPPTHRPPAAETAGGLNPDPTPTSSVRPRPSNRPSNRRSLGLRLHSEPTFAREAANAAIEPPTPQQQQQQQPQQPLSPEVSQHAAVLAHRSFHAPESAAAASTLHPAVGLNAGPEQTAAALTGRLAVLAEDVQPSSSERHDAAHTEETQPTEQEEKLDVSQGATVNLSHVTPNTSLGFVHATPSRVLPSPTVNTREALDVIMDMFQAPTLLEEPFGGTSALHAADAELHPGYAADGASSFSKPPTSAAFTVFQDADADKENGSAAAAQKSKPVRALAEISNKPNDTPPDLAPDESTMWGARYNSLHSLAACPNSTSDFALLARCVSTPSTHKTPSGGNFYQDPETCDGDAEDEGFMRRQQKKLSPILEQSPLEDTGLGQPGPSSAGHGTIVGEGLAAAPPCLTSSSISMAHAAPAALSFRDHTAAAPVWEACSSPAPPPRPAAEPFTIMEDLEEPEQRVQDVPMSPECAPRPDWLAIRSPEVAVQPDLDLDAFLSPHAAAGRTQDVPMSPLRPVSPEQDQLMASPARGEAPAAPPLVSDPWDDQLISDLLSSLAPPLTAHPRCLTWRCSLPSFSPRTTISMGKASLRVDGVLGEGAFAKVYQATDPTTSEKMVLKVQKPANPWEFYIHTQLAARLRPDLRRLFASVHSAHLFDNGSVLLGTLHGYGTLLNAVNMFKGLSEKVMPQPLVMYFAVRILHMVEQLHAVRIVHADIKPDNFLLGESFLENRRLEAEDADHGLVLVDMGQSIDMELFPEGTAFTARCMTSGFQCTEMLSGKPWSYQTDYFGVAGTVHCLLFGTYMQVTNDGGVWKTNGVFRRNPHSELWQHFFHALLNVADCSSPPSLRDLRGRLEAELRQNYGGKLATLKSRLVVLLLEAQRAARR